MNNIDYDRDKDKKFIINNLNSLIDKIQNDLFVVDDFIVERTGKENRRITLKMSMMDFNLKNGKKYE